MDFQNFLLRQEVKEQLRQEVKEQLSQTLLDQIKAQLPQLEELLESVVNCRHTEDRFYRFYHYSLKVYSLQETTETIVKALQNLMPGDELNDDFMRIIREGTGKTFELAHNDRWHEETRPILEAYFHAKTMLELAIKSGKSLETSTNLLPSGWAAVLYLYNLR